MADHSAAIANSSLGLDRAFLDQALARGDVCIGYFVGGALVSCFWCGFDRVPADGELMVRVPTGHSYAYKAMTLLSHRGQRLQQQLTAANDRLLCEQGFTHNIEYIEVSNFPQRRASLRYGNRTIGLAGYVANRRGPWVFHSPRVKRVGFAFERVGHGE